jgi:putative FmdB family regulatory protein
MPTYQYHCTKCDQEFDVFQSMTENPLTTCRKDVCRMNKWGKGKVKKLISAGAGLIFKGSGFYITDYRSDSYKEAAKKDSAASAPASSDSKSSSESKAAPAKTEAKPKTESKTKAQK